MPTLQWIGLFLEETLINMSPKGLLPIEASDLKKYEEILSRPYFKQVEAEFANVVSSFQDNFELSLTINYQMAKINSWKESIVSSINQKLKAEIELLNEFSHDFIIYYIRDQILKIEKKVSY